MEIDESRSKNISHCLNVVPTSSSDLQVSPKNKYLNTDKGSDAPIVSSCEIENEHDANIIKQNGYIDSKIKTTNPFINNNDGIKHGPSNTVPMTPNSHHAIGINNTICNNVSSHNTSRTNSSLKTQKSFKLPNTNPANPIVDDYDDNMSNKKSYMIASEAVKEIGRFSPTPTPYVDFPLQFNFGSTYASSVTVFFDDN